MTYMLDTNICIYVIKNKPKEVLRRFQENMDRGLCVSSITLAELQYGVEKSAKPEKNRMALLQFLAFLEVLPFDDCAAVEYGRIRAYLHQAGTPIGTMDMLIAAHAVASSLTVVTNNIREFARVPGLRVENWVSC